MAAFITSFNSLKANPIGIKTAREVALNFMNTKAQVSVQGKVKAPLRNGDIQLLTTYRTRKGTAAFHVFNTPSGFVMVAADDCATPILGYSDEGRPFDTDNIPIQLQGYLQGFVKQIEYGIENHIKSKSIAQQWTQMKEMGRLIEENNPDAVKPLLTTQWDQWQPYNMMCPEGCPTGCVATAVAQIMNYWKYPAKGVGYNEYVTPGYGVGHHQVAYNETHYQWDLMDVYHPETIGTLMYHAGTSCWTHYNYGSSGSSIESAMDGLRTYFDYSDNMKFCRREGDTVMDIEWNVVPDANWVSLLKTNLRDGYPILYAGGSATSHAWVIDGFDDANMFHMNFGWSGQDNGYYSIDVIYVGMDNFSDAHSMIINIKPANTKLTCQFEYAVDEYNEMEYTFHDFTKGNYDSLEWNFGDGNSSSSVNPTHAYTSDGLYTVKLCVYQGGQMESIEKAIDVRRNKFFRRVFPYTGDPAETPAGLIHTVDYDMDGRQDIIVYGLSGISITHNTETGFVANETTITSSDAYDLKVVDFYNTNQPSLFSLKNKGFWSIINGAYVYDANFALSINDDLIDRPYDVVDYNNDGLMDIIAFQHDYAGKIYKNIGNGNFQSLDYVFPAFGTWLDVDNDGDLDCLSQWQGDVNTIYFHNCINDGHGNFYEEKYPSGCWGDFNGDGLADVLAGDVLAGELMINQGNGTFKAMNSAFFEEYKDYGDIDNDGNIEIIYGDSVARIVGNTVERMQNDYHIPWFSWGDPNGTNSLNMLSSVEWPWSDNHMGTYLNISTTPNTPPAAPTGLYVDIMGNDVILHWNAPTDDHTPSAALTYNIAVGTSPNACDIYSPLSDLATGHRYYMNRGNAGYAPLWRVNELPNGTYYWRVQAIDQALAASAFSEVFNFTIDGGNIKPSLGDMKTVFSFGSNSPIGKQVFLKAFVDRDHGTFVGIQISSLPKYGHLSLYGNTVELGQYISFNDLDSLCYLNTNYLNAQDTIYVKAFDGVDYGQHSSPLYLSGKLFEPVEVTLPEGKSIWGDYDNDGDLDLATSAGFYQNVNGLFSLAQAFTESKTPIAWLDYKDDGLLDCLFVDSLFVNNGDGTFTPQVINLGVNLAYKSDFNDMNNNNNVDIIYDKNDSLFVKYDWGEDTYLNIQAMRDGAAIAADWNNDGRLDLANTGFDWGNHRAMTVYRNSTNILVPVKDLDGLGVGNLQWGDYDRDGDLDLLATGSDNFGSPCAKLYKNVGGDFVLQEVSLAGIYGNAYWFDFDNDGFLDVILSGYYEGTRLYRNNQDGNFEEISPEVSWIPKEFHSIEIGDYDNDGYMDILLSGTLLIRNLLGTSNKHDIQPSASPIQLQSNVRGERVRLSWSFDNVSEHNSYNVYVRKEGESGFIVSPLSDLATGYRKVVRIGNAEYKTFFNLDSLETGTYYWSVQAIDNAYHGGPFSPESSFTVATYVIVATANPDTGGTITGTGTYDHGAKASLTAKANKGYTFVNWTKDGEEVSKEPTYSFIVTEAADYVANFDKLLGINDSENLPFIIYPNPAVDRLNVESQLPIRQCEVYSINGGRLISLEKCGKKFEINVQHLPAGNYLIRLVSDRAVECRIFVKI